jgi:hypothetical protein
MKITLPTSLRPKVRIFYVVNSTKFKQLQAEFRGCSRSQIRMQTAWHPANKFCALWKKYECNLSQYKVLNGHVGALPLLWIHCARARAPRYTASRVSPIRGHPSFAFLHGKQSACLHIPSQQQLIISIIGTVNRTRVGILLSKAGFAIPTMPVAGRSRVWLQEGARDFSLLQNVQIGSGAHTASYSIGIGVPSRR